MATQTIHIKSKTTTVKKKTSLKKKSGSNQRGKNKRCPTCGKFRSP